MVIREDAKKMGVVGVRVASEHMEIGMGGTHLHYRERSGCATS